MTRSWLLLACLPLLLTACGSLLLTGGTTAGVSIAENRSIGRSVDDTVIYTDLTNQFLQAEQAELLAKVTFNVRFARVMLTGNVEREEDARRAVELAWKAKGVTEIINELVINPDANLLKTAGDSIIKRNLETRFLITKDVWVINYSIDVQNGVAYLIGRVKDKAELTRALNVARTTRGIKRLVSHLQINPDTQHSNYGFGTDAPTDPNDDATGLEPSPTLAPVSSPQAGSSSGGDIYTGPVYSGGSISSSPIEAPASSGLPR